MNGNDLIMISPVPWNAKIGNNIKDMAIQLSQTNRILFVNPPLTRKNRMFARTDLVKEHINAVQAKKTITQINSHIWVLYPKTVVESINWIKNRNLFSVLNKYNNYLFYKNVNAAITELNFSNKIVIIDNSLFLGFYCKEYLRAQTSIFYIRDNLPYSKYWETHGTYFESELIKKSNIVVTNSEFYKEKALGLNKNSFMIGQGFVPAPTILKVIEIDKSLLNIKHPVIGYLGGIYSSRLDIELIGYIAEKLPDYNFVFIGEQDKDFKASSLHNNNNVHFFDKVPFKYIYNYIYLFDVCINPQVVNEFTIGNYPRKADEYLHIGKPVVATRTHAMKMFEKHIYLSENKEMFANLIKKAYNEDCPEKREQRKEFASLHSWENCIAEMKIIYDRVVYGKV